MQHRQSPLSNRDSSILTKVTPKPLLRRSVSANSEAVVDKRSSKRPPPSINTSKNQTTDPQLSDLLEEIKSLRDAVNEALNKLVSQSDDIGKLREDVNKLLTENTELRSK